MSPEDYDSNDFDKSMMNIDYMDTSEVTINPDFYIHVLFIKINLCLANNDLKSATQQYYLLVEQLESVVLSSNKFFVDRSAYETKLKEKIEDYRKNNKETSDILSNFIQSKKKFEVLSQAVFSKKMLNNSMKI